MGEVIALYNQACSGIMKLVYRIHPLFKQRNFTGITHFAKADHPQQWRKDVLIFQAIHLGARVRDLTGR